MATDVTMPGLISYPQSPQKQIGAMRSQEHAIEHQKRRKAS
jgi:hypothetical protein